MLKRLTLTATLTGILAAAWAAPVVLRPDRREIPGADEPTAYLCYAHPGATGVVVAGSWDDWNHRHPMAWSNGLWILDVRPLRLPFGRHEFKFIIDGEWEPGENRILYANMRGLLERPPAILVQALVQDSHTIDLVLKHPLPPATIRKLALRVLPDRRVKEWHPLSPPESGFVEGYVMGGNVVTFTLSEKTYGLDLAPTSTVAVAGTFNGWRTAAPGWRLHDPDDDGIWTLTVPRAALPYPAPGRYVQFKFVLDGRRWLPPPPHAPNAQYDGKGNINLTIDPRRRGSNVIRLVTEDPLEISTNYVVAIEGLRARPIYRMTTPGRALDRFVSHKPLGVSLHRDQQATTYRLFSPRATQVWLCIYTSAWFRSRDNPATPIAPAERYPMWKDPADGVWEISLLGLDTGKYYSFNIAGPRGDAESFDPRTPVGDPYALAAAHAHNNTIVLDPHLTNRWFGGWNDADFRRPAPQDLVIYEMHLRDMTIHSSSRVPPLLRGKYAGLLATRGKGTGLDHLKWLGVNTIELLPVAEFSNRETDYDWGYAPVYYFAPEASYALRPLQGSQYYEFKNLINELHREGFAVILDVVFNHVGSPNIFYFIDKKYFFRLTPDFRFLNFSGCGNDLRTEAPMMRRLIIDNVLYWIREFHVDGFRFDLAELVDMQTMLAVRDAARSVDPGIILISEPWSFRGDQRHQLTGTGWSAWNGDFRHVAREFVLGEENRTRLKQYIFGSLELWAADPLQPVNYLESHDDMVLADELCTRPDRNGRFLQENDVRANRLAATILFTSLGIPMLGEGQEFLRSKMGRNNTYNLGDRYNAIRWNDRQRPMAAETMQYYRGLIRMRLSPPGRAFRLRRRPPPDYYQWIEPADPHALGYIVNARRTFPGNTFVVLLNAAVEPVTFAVPFPAGTWKQISDGKRVHLRGLAGRSAIRGGRVVPLTVQGLGSAIYMDGFREPAGTPP